MSQHRLRDQILRRPRQGGGVDLYDPVFDRVVSLDAEEQAALEQGLESPAWTRLEAAMMTEGPVVSAILEAMLDAKLAQVPRPAPSAEVDARFDWSVAEALPALVRPEWRSGERWRRLAEERASGRRYLMMRGLVEDAAVDALHEAIAALEFRRLETALVRGDRHAVGPGELSAWIALMEAATTRALFGAVLGVGELPRRTVVNAWRLGVGDGMGVHADGKRYCATLSLGLSRGWTAADGGAIAFGQPREGGAFEVTERWLPHAGDGLLFAPSADTWHAVETVVRGPRHTLTGWWMLE